MLKSTKIHFNISIETSIVDPDQTAPAPHCLSMRLQIFQWTTKNIHFVSMPLRVNKWEFRAYTDEMHRWLHGPIF